MDGLKAHRRATPWLDYPLIFSGNYREHECDLTEEQCAYQSGYWRNWYEADHRYALPTIAFFMAVIALFSLIHLVGILLPPSPSNNSSKGSLLSRSRSIYRFLSYRTYRIARLNWNSAPLGLLLLASLGTLFFLCMTLAPTPYYWPNNPDEGIDFGSSPPIATRAGWMSLACMPFVFATAGKINFVTVATGVSHERLQVFHRWISYAFFVLALVHTFPFIVYNFQAGMMGEMWNGMVFYWTGVVALLAQFWLTFGSWGPLRTLAYEWFKVSHFLAAVIFMVFLFFHCDATLTAWDYFVATGVLFAVSWLSRQARIFFEHGINHKAELSLASNGFIRVSIPTAALWDIGQHYFVRFMVLGLHSWTLHPFTACSLPGSLPVETTGVSGDAARDEHRHHLVLFIRPRGGFTGRLARYVETRPNSRVTVLLDGPYGGIDARTVRQSQRLLVIAGGSGAGWALPFLVAFLGTTARESATAKVKGDEAQLSSSPRSLKIVLATRDQVTMAWFEDEVRQILGSFATARSPAVNVEMYYTGSEVNKTRPAETGQFLQKLDAPEKVVDLTSTSVEPASSSKELGDQLPSEVHEFRRLESRPALPAMVREESGLVGEGRSLGVFVCGPLSMQSDVSNAVAAEQLRFAGDIRLHLEHFSWA